MATLLSICQEVAGALSLPIATAYAGSTDQTASLIYYCARKEGEALARRSPGGWATQVVEYTFTTVAVGPFTGTSTISSTTLASLSSVVGIVAGMYVTGPGIFDNTTVISVGASSVVLSQAATSSNTGGNYQFGKCDYALPSDFKRFVDNTMWDRTRFWQMRGALSPQEWQLFKSSPIGQASLERRWRVRNASGAAAGSGLKFSIDPSVMDNGSTLVFEYVSNAWCTSSGGTLQTQWAADTDIPLLDSYLMTLGIEWRTLERLGLSFDTELAEYELEVDKAIARDSGSTTLDMAPSGNTFLLGPWNIPETGFGS